MKRERQALLADRALVGAALRAALVELYDGYLAELWADPGPGLALIAVGSLGRAEPSPGSDLDLLLLHDGTREIGGVADKLWYPLWNSGVGIDHSVRTPAEALGVARTDLKAALGLLDARHIAGDPELTAGLVREVRAAWRKGAAKRLPELHAAVQQRARTAGEVAFLLEPDLKEARGGLRDVHALQALAVAQVADPPAGPVRAAYLVLLDVRDELHRAGGVTGRHAANRLLLQEQDAVAAGLGLRDADALMAEVSGAARRIAFASDGSWRRATPTPTRRRRLGRRRPEPLRRPLAVDVLEQAGEVVLARGAEPRTDPVLPLRVAQAAAMADLPIAPHTLERLVEQCPPLPTPWPQPALDALVGLLAAGSAAIAVLEALDQSGLLVALLPEWEQVRSRPQRNSYHRFTVDRHLVETAAAAAALTRQVARPDLLLLGALLHDIGKGLPGDHTDVGVQLVGRIGPRLGLPTGDVDVLVAMVRHHLLLPDVATRRDLDDPATARAVAAAVQTPELLELLHALTEADSAATGPAAWSRWKGQLIEALVRKTGALLAGRTLPPPEPLAGWQRELLRTGRLNLGVQADEVTVVAPDRPGLLAMAAGLMSLHRLDVRSASAFLCDAMGVSVLRVSPRFGALPDWSVVTRDLRRAADGDLDLTAALADRERAYAGRDDAVRAGPTVRLIDDASDSATVVEVRAADRLGLLYRITTALGDCGLNVRSAHICSLGADLVDAFYVVGPDGGKLTDHDLRQHVVEQVRQGFSCAAQQGGSHN